MPADGMPVAIEIKGNFGMSNWQLINHYIASLYRST